MLIKKILTNSEFKFYNLHCKNSHTDTPRHLFPKLSNTHFSSFVRTGHVAYLCSVEGKPKKNISVKFKFSNV